MSHVTCHFLYRKNLQRVERKHVCSLENPCAQVTHLHPSHRQYWLALMPFPPPSSSASCSQLHLSDSLEAKECSVRSKEDKKPFYAGREKSLGYLKISLAFLKFTLLCWYFKRCLRPIYSEQWKKLFLSGMWQSVQIIHVAFMWQSVQIIL